MDTKHFNSHEAIKEFFEKNPKDTNWTIFGCYETVLAEGGPDSVRPFSFEEDGKKLYVEVEADEVPLGLSKLMNKAVSEEHYEAAQQVKELAREHGFDLDADGTDLSASVTDGD